MKIFLSSTYRDLFKIRESAINFLKGITGNITNSTGEIVAMEFFAASENTCKEECLYNLSDCNLVIGIYGESYGSIDTETNLSMTELEFDYAVQNNIPILALVMYTEKRDSRETEFIENKVYKRGKSCAHFHNPHDFMDRLDNSLKQYLKTYDGYSIDSLWNQIATLKDDITKNISLSSPGAELQMKPYISNQEDLALDDILSCTYAIKEYIKNLQCENDAIHSYAYTKTHYPENITSEDIQCLRTNIDRISKTILLNWELINLGLYNQTTHIILATMFLKLSRMQHRLLTEPWNEELRKDVITTRTLYIETINNSQYTD